MLTPDNNRFVMFPIQHNDIWLMYKKQVDCFWRPEEIDLTKDLKDWSGLTSRSSRRATASSWRTWRSGSWSTCNSPRRARFTGSKSPWKISTPSPIVSSSTRISKTRSSRTNCFAPSTPFRVSSGKLSGRSNGYKVRKPISPRAS